MQPRIPLSEQYCPIPLKKFARSFSPRTPEKEKVSRGHFPRATKPDIAEPEVRHVPAAVRRTEVPRRIVPGTAPNHSCTFRVRARWILRRRIPIIVFAVPITHPFKHVAPQVVDSLRRHAAQKQSHRAGMADLCLVIIAPFPVWLFVPPRIVASFAATRRSFPFRLRGYPSSGPCAPSRRFMP